MCILKLPNTHGTPFILALDQMLHAYSNTIEEKTELEKSKLMSRLNIK